MIILNLHKFLNIFDKSLSTTKEFLKHITSIDPKERFIGPSLYSLGLKEARNFARKEHCVLTLKVFPK